MCGILRHFQMVWLYKGKDSFVPDAFEETQEERSPSADNTGQEMNQIRTSEVYLTLKHFCLLF